MYAITLHTYHRNISAKAMDEFSFCALKEDKSMHILSYMYVY